jgi:hypothetical protein
MDSVVEDSHLSETVQQQFMYVMRSLIHASSSLSRSSISSVLDFISQNLIGFRH